jgi:hypothetical protein
MRQICAFISLAMCACVSAVAFAFDAFAAHAASFRGYGKHFHLIPGEPRSILDTRRMGLA